MKKIVITALIGLAVIFLSECKSTKSAVVSAPAPPIAAPVAEAPKTEANPATELIANGQAVYQAKCYQCHDLPRASSYSQSEWSDIMIKMSRKAHLSDLETDQVLAYVNANSRQ